MATFVITTASGDEISSINPAVELVHQAGDFRIYAVKDPQIALRQWENAIDVLRRDAAVALDQITAEAIKNLSSRKFKE